MWAIDQLVSPPTENLSDGCGRLLVGLGQDRRRRQTWLEEIASLWDDRKPLRLGKTVHAAQRFDGKGIAKELRRARASGSLEAFRKSLKLGLPPVRGRQSNTHQRAVPHCILIDRLDTAGVREDDLLLLCQLIDSLLARPTLLAVTLPRHPTTLELHPAVESRLEAGLMIPLGTGEKPPAHASGGTPLSRRRPLAVPGSSGKKNKAGGTKPAARPPTIRRIISTVARYYGIEADDILGSSQRRCHVRPRGLAIHCVHLLTGKSSHAIGRAIGGRDHTTVLHSLKVTANLIHHDPGYAGDFATVIEQLTGRSRRR
jgi:hypothetical protein